MPLGIREAIDSDIYEQFAQIHVPITEHTEDVAVLIGNEEYHASVTQKDMV